MDKEDAEAREEEGLDMLDNESSPTREDDFFILLGLCLSNAVTANEETTICCLNALSDLLTPAMLALPSFDYVRARRGWRAATPFRWRMSCLLFTRLSLSV